MTDFCNKTKELHAWESSRTLRDDIILHLYRPDHERDYGQEAIEILLQVTENQGDDREVILAGYRAFV
jgi:hypothetical protein